jgi:hypothetical protein
MKKRIKNIGLDVHKNSISVGIADDGRVGVLLKSSITDGARHVHHAHHANNFEHRGEPCRDMDVPRDHSDVGIYANNLHR